MVEESPWTVALADAAARDVGPKARNLARLIGAGLPVPDGFALTHAAWQAGDGTVATAVVTAELHARARGLGATRFAVRSSISLEDGEHGAGAGVFVSAIDVADDQLEAALAAVWASASSPLARAYAHARGGERVDAALLVGAPIGLPVGVRVGVIIQRFIPGQRATVYTRPPGEPASPDALVSWHDDGDAAPARRRREATDTRPDDSTDRALALALAAERAIAASAGADVELVADGDGDAMWVVQARPVVHPPRLVVAAEPPALLFAFSRAAPSQIWAWDAGHNPDPLSPAQQGLVELVEAAGAAPDPLRVVGGYLYAARGHRAPAPASDRAGEPLTIDGFRAALTAIRAAIDRALTPPPSGLEPALAAYLAVYRLWAGELAPLIRAARVRLPDTLRAAAAELSADERDRLIARLLGHGDPTRLEAAIGAAARGALSHAAVHVLAAPMAPAWDVASPTYGERPAVIDAAIELARGRAEARPASAFPDDDPLADPLAGALSAPARAAIVGAVALARAAATAAELDDLDFARAQATVRGALRAVATAWEMAHPDDIFWLPLDLVRAAERDGAPLDPLVVERRAAAARAAAARQRGWRMPIAFAEGAPLPEAAGRDDASPASWRWFRGIGTGPCVDGVAVRIDDLAAAMPIAAGAIAVVATVTPAMTFLLQGAAAIVAAHGGLLDHGAAIARELGIPCVVGCRGVLDGIADGDHLVVDGARGLVIKRS